MYMPKYTPRFGHISCPADDRCWRSSGPGPSSVRELSRATARDYRSVHTDERVLESIGLIERTEENSIVVPWDVVTADSCSPPEKR
jgi:hypothetical protein